MGETKQTTDHETIKSWINERDGYPAHVKHTGNNENGIGILKVGFQNPEGDLERVEWDAFFKAFDANRLSFLYQEKTADGALSRFNQFVDR